MSDFCGHKCLGFVISSDCSKINQIQGTRSKKRWRTMGQICPVLSTRIWTLSPGLENNHTFKYWSGIFPTIWTCMIKFENCQYNISVYGCSPIQGTKFYSCWNFMKLGLQSDTYLTDNVLKVSKSMMFLFISFFYFID